ncbi:SusD/RagB family nutrient-binding outer membrane lipoprotein [Pricia sp. S334]|uniref:SusD/RagB family nutrient-binding outer membrane lipoprotein n=1 Tax=Pricia mediterranea TaxID=3076079 RepID=A0ABU3L2H8_9FLAO|nr:SusD/RagB family nutrient-binding outer membrane lipoprotein [Pricia sp. S334]MDT7827946.1 SusD/RagB family nutrient-binding outer membrane lipoprotein [Pricia sp. S334]
MNGKKMNTMLKQYKKYIYRGLCISFITLALNSCESTELEILESPNALAPTQADVDLFLNSIQIKLAAVLDGTQSDDNAGLSERGMEVTRLLHMFGPTYENAYLPGDVDIVYEDTYAGLLADTKAILEPAEEAGLYTHKGIAKAIEAYTFMTLVDFFGDMPFSEAIQGTEFPNPSLDDDAAIYAAVETLLNDALTEFNRDEAFGVADDIFYGGNEDQWIKLVNTLKLKLYLQTRLIDSNAGAKINALVADGNIILDSADDFQFQYSSTDANPDSRHPIFGRNFDVAADVSDYMSNYYMVLLKDSYPTGDPRTRYYFYRQSLNFTDDANEADCVTQSAPVHFELSDVFCDAGNGYWGRDHGDNDGIPPDGGLRSTWGVYPIGGLMDINQGAAIPGRDIGLEGAGISPIMLASFTNFMLAEAALVTGVTGDPRAYLEAGVRASINKVIAFGEGLDYLDDAVDETRTVRDVYVPAQENIDQYVTNVLDDYDAASATGKLEVIVKEYFKALFGNGVEAYNTYRRTGFPSDLQPTLLAEPGEFINSFIYPSEMVDQNSNISQKPNQAVRVFWAEGGPTVD